MAVSLSKVGKKYEVFNNRSSGYTKTFRLESDSSKMVLMLPPHESMNEIPWVEMMFHGRQLPKDVKASFSIRCQRDSREDADFSKCWACTKAGKHRKMSTAKDDKDYNLAGDYMSRPKPVSQVIDVTPCFNKKGDFKRPLKKCYGKFGKMDDCDDCRFSESCESFVQKWFMPIGVWKEFADHFGDEGDITDFKAAIPIRVKRDGKGLQTRYGTKAFPKFKMEIGSGIVKRIMKKLIDLTKEDPKPSADSTKELNKIYKDFFNLKDVTDSDDDDDDDDDDVKVEKKKKKKDKKKGKKKKSGDLDDLRRQAKRRAKKGKLDR